MLKLKVLFFSCCKPEPSQNEVEQELGPDVYIQTAECQPRSKNQLGSHHHTIRTNHSQQIPEEEIKNSPKLKLIAIEGSIIPLNTEFLLNAGGLIDGGRGKKDGETYIGCVEKERESDTNMLNDIVLDDTTLEIQHCMIKYNSEKKTYFLHHLEEGSGAFLKIQDELELKSGYIVSFSDSHMVVHTRGLGIGSEEDHSEDKKGQISIKFLDGPKGDQIFVFKPEDKIIKLGRMTDCQIKFDENNLSRYQCTFKRMNNAWYIADGTGSKPSTNGTWLLVDHNIELPHGSILKIGQTVFQVEIQTQS